MINYLDVSARPAAMVEYFPPGPIVIAPEGGLFIDLPVDAGAVVVALVVVAGVVAGLVVVVGLAVVPPVPGTHYR